MDVFVLFAVLMITLVIGVPIGFAIAGATFIVVTMFTSTNLTVMAAYCTSGINSFPIMAIPFFILAGSIMSFGGIARRIVDVAMSLVGHIVGGLGAVVSLATLFFATMCGTGMAAVAAMGGVMIPEMIKKEYSRSYSAAVTACAGTMGPIIPPSLLLVIYGVSTQTSIGELFIAGIIPGVLMGVGILTTNYLICRKDNIPCEVKAPPTKMLKGVWEAKWALLCPAIILGGIYSGIFTPTESAAVAVIYCAIVSVVIYKELSLKQMYEALLDTAVINGMTTFLLGTCTAFGGYLALEQVPAKLLQIMQTFTDNKIIFLLLTNVLLLLLGMVLDAVPAIMITSPILLPVVIGYGMDPVHFGIIMCINLAIGLVTPPYGCNLFVAAAVAEISLDQMLGYVAKFLTSLIIVLLLVTYIPFISLMFIR